MHAISCVMLYLGALSQIVFVHVYMDNADTKQV